MTKGFGSKSRLTFFGTSLSASRSITSLRFSVKFLDVDSFRVSASFRLFPRHLLPWAEAALAFCDESSASVDMTKFAVNIPALPKTNTTGLYNIDKEMNL